MIVYSVNYITSNSCLQCLYFSERQTQPAGEPGERGRTCPQCATIFCEEGSTCVDDENSCGQCVPSRKLYIHTTILEFRRERKELRIIYSFKCQTSFQKVAFSPV